MAHPVPSDTPAVVLVSGGLDSAVALAAAVKEGYRCHALSFDYGQRHRHELKAAERVARQVGAADHKVVGVDLRAIGGSALTAEIEVPKGRMGERGERGEKGGSGGASGEGKTGREAGRHGLEAHATEIPVTYVPARNLIFLSLAVAYAETLGAWDIFLGVNSVDYSGYPDCRWPFIAAFVEAANLATKAWDDRKRRSGRDPRGFTVHAPLINHDKVQIIKWGKRLGVDYSLTHSCYDPDGEGRACGRCDSCVIRARGFAEAGVADPTRYGGGEVAEWQSGRVAK